jgi:hypothetical protein
LIKKNYLAVFLQSTSEQMRLKGLNTHLVLLEVLVELRPASVDELGGALCG